MVQAQADFYPGCHKASNEISVPVSFSFPYSLRFGPVGNHSHKRDYGVTDCLRSWTLLIEQISSIFGDLPTKFLRNP